MENRIPAGNVDSIKCPLCGGGIIPKDGTIVNCSSCNERFTWKKNLLQHKRIIDISFKDPVTKFLSNLHAYNFALGNYIYASFEAFLRCLVIETTEQNIQLKKEVSRLSGADAYFIREFLPDWREKQILYFEGEIIERSSPRYQDILDIAYNALFENSAIFRLALKKSTGKILVHTNGHHEKMETLLTEEEYISRLNKLREKFI